MMTATHPVPTTGPEATSTYETILAMAGLTIMCKDHLRKVCEFADSVNAADRLVAKCEYLATYGQAWGHKTRCHLYSDWAPHSFAFLIEGKQADGTWTKFFNGGLIYSGPGQALDGGMPALTVSLGHQKFVHDWSTHT